ncbi:unnamed protein product [Protopolystoma xenopodis]|uniref:Uncharacterized protein n=1 Tax=Protopolystoma xenopodis TaxID=117903 RepID=A0A3S5CN30_9PLAT|nr:unnamed protein product [Protopolystoma xenopodis]
MALCIRRLVERDRLNAKRRVPKIGLNAINGSYRFNSREEKQIQNGTMVDRVAVEEVLVGVSLRRRYCSAFEEEASCRGHFCPV